MGRRQFCGHGEQRRCTRHDARGGFQLTPRKKATLLAGDIGGTKTDLALFSAEAGPRAPLVEARFPSADYASLEEVVRTFLTQAGRSADSAAFGVAGPVVAGQADITNLPWIMTETHLQEALHL